MDMKELEKLIPTLLPLILIIVVSWVFSFLASKMRKPQQQGNESSSPARGDDVLGDLLNLGKGESAAPGAQGRVSGSSMGEVEPINATDWRSSRRLQAPTVSSEPIKPKWWGA